MINTEGDTHPEIIENQENVLDMDADYLAWIATLEQPQPDVYEIGEEEPKQF